MCQPYIESATAHSDILHSASWDIPKINGSDPVIPIWYS